MTAVKTLTASANEVYCVKCKKMVALENGKRVTLNKTNRPALKSVCPNCGTSVYKIVSNKS